MTSDAEPSWVGRASRTVVAWWRRRLESLRQEPVVSALTIALVCFGLVLRARGYFFDVRAFWIDESAWALLLMKEGYADQYLRPLGFMVVSKAMSSLFSPSEQALRALPWLAGAATVVIAPLLAKRLFSGAPARLLFVAILAFHPSAIDLSNEFKPYSVSLLLHVTLLFSTLRYLSLGRSQDLALVLGVAFLGPFFAQDTVFAFPGTFGVLAWTAYRRERSHLRWIVLGAASIIVTLAAHYVFIWRHVTHEEASYWGNRYGVFYHADGSHSRLAWFFEKHRDLVDFPGSRRSLWRSDALSRRSLQTLRNLDAVLWSFLHVAGLARLIWKKRVAELALTLLPFLTLWSFNTLEFWPTGAFRTNLFVLCYATAIASAAFDWPLRGRARHFAALAPALLVLAPLVPFENDWHATKRAGGKDGPLPSTLATLIELRRAEKRPRRETLLINATICAEWKYYTQLHPGKARLLRSTGRYFDARCARKPTVAREILRLTSAGERVWTILYHDEKPEKLSHAPDGSTLEFVEHTARGTHRIAVFQRPPVDGEANASRRGASSRRPR